MLDGIERAAQSVNLKMGSLRRSPSGILATVTLANNDVAIYVNGVLDAGSRSDSADLPYAACACAVVFGCTSDQVSGSFVTGGIDDIRIWNRALAPAEMQVLASVPPQSSAAALAGVVMAPSVPALPAGTFLPFFAPTNARCLCVLSV